MIEGQPGPPRGVQSAISIVRQSLAVAMRAQSIGSKFFVQSLSELHLGKLSETVVVHGNAPLDRPRVLVSHLIGNRASFLCTKAPMLRNPRNELSASRRI